MPDPYDPSDAQGPSSDHDQFTDHRDGVDPIVYDPEQDQPSGLDR